MTPAVKVEARRLALSARTALDPGERSVRSARIAARAASLGAFDRARTIALYFPLGAEVDPAPLEAAARAAGKRVAYPLILPGERALGFACCTASELVPGRLGTREPAPAAPSLELAALDLVIVPGVAFDGAGRRLGRGAGHYDATLAGLSSSAVTVGLAFEAQMLREVPQEAHDARLDVLVTESRVLLLARRTG